MFRLGLPVSHSGQNVIHLHIYARAWKRKTKKHQQRFSLRGVQEHVPAVELSRAEHHDPIMPRGIAPHDLVHDESSQGTSAEHSEQLEGDDSRVSRAPSRVRGGVFAPFTRWSAKRKEGRFSDVHISARAPSDAFTVRPNVDRARKEPSKMKWMSASNVCVGVRVSGRSPFTRGGVAVSGGAGGKKKEKKKKRRRSLQGGYVRAR